MNILCTTPPPIFIPLTCSIPIVSMYFQLEWKTVWILIRLLRHPQIWIYSVFFFFKKDIYLGSAGQVLSVTVCMYCDYVRVLVPIFH